MKKTIKIGTRASNLALAQTKEVIDRLLDNGFNHFDFQIIKIITQGDKITDRSLIEIGGKSLFVKEIEESLINNEIDMAVHSMKDMTALIPDSLKIAAVLPREDPRDALVSYIYKSLEEIPKNSIFGTSSSRRREFLKHKRPDLELIEFRGNVNTRLKKLEDKNIAGTILAMAGIKRLGIKENFYPIDDFIPAVAQGAIGVEIRKDDFVMQEILDKINHKDSFYLVNLERIFLNILQADCRTPLGCNASFVDGEVNIKACYFNKKIGGFKFVEARSGVNNAEELAKELALKLL